MRILDLGAFAERCRGTDLKYLQAAGHLSNLLELSDEAVLLVDGALGIVDLNRSAERLFEPGGEARGRPLTDWLPGLNPAQLDENPAGEILTVAHRGDGAVFSARVRMAGNRALGMWTVLVADLDRHRLAERELEAVEKLILAVNEADGTETALGEALSGIREMIGWEAAAAWLPDAKGEYLHPAVGFLPGRETPPGDLPATVRRGEGLAGRAWSRGQPEWADAGERESGYNTGLAIPIFVGGEFIAVLCFHTRRVLTADERLSRLSSAIAGHLGAILQRKRVEDRLHYLAHHDPLTGVANRALLQERIDHGRMDANRRGRLFAILHLGLDRFKSINDAFGYPAGDRLLQQVAERLRATVRGSDTVARLGGDEFVLLLTDLAQVDNTAGIAKKILDCLAAGFVLGGHLVPMSASMGITVYPHDALDTDALLHNAETAMNRAKEEGGGSYRFHTEEMSVRVRERLSLERDLQGALRRGELTLHYQPIFELASGAFTHVETLARWFHPQRGEVSPSVFIPLAEETGMIVELGEWILRTACHQAAEWQQSAQVQAPHVAVNISARELGHGEFVARLENALAETGCDPSRLTIEITESLFIDADMIEVLRAVSATGVKLSIDDFGTGYSSLAYLRRLPLDYLKIDRSFVHDLPEDAEATALVTAIMSMAHALGLKVVAEGIETQAQLRHLHEQGCDLVQGFYLAVPMPGKDVASLLRARSRAIREGLVNGAGANQPG
jgi:diguanylate cyclase (GGDEF)-like protein